MASQTWGCFGRVLNLEQKGLKEPYDWDEYARMFFPKAEELAKIAVEAEKAGEKEKASEYYLSVPFSVAKQEHHSHHAGEAQQCIVSHGSPLLDRNSKNMLGQRARKSSTKAQGQHTVNPWSDS